MLDEQFTANGNDQCSLRGPDDYSSDVPRFSLRSLLIAVTVCCVVLGIWVPLARHARRTTQRMSCSNNMKQIILALHCYHDVYEAFPPAITYDENGAPMHSWRVLIYPFVEQSALLDVYDCNEPWDGPNNKLLGDELPDIWFDNSGNASNYVHHAGVYRCPSAPASQHEMMANYVMLIDDRPGKPNGPPKLPGSSSGGRITASTVILVEIADTDIHWMEPRDVLLSELSFKINDRSKRSLSSFHGGAFVAHADGSVHILEDDLSEERLRDLLTQ